MNAVKIYEDAKWKLEHNEITLGEFEEMIKPLEDVRENIHGEWEKVPSFLPNYQYFVCSVCMTEALQDESESAQSNFCPNCGADMRGETK